ncbi:beta-hexosaminidase subunit beta-like [Mytilus californianus]|uniref:beta-hexosaminidase subunit beta-like n=1 Tax=Mytilus californianus TaxID=6549 RepID=UPI0022462FD4|nr:beta-hexosaminidase subunit beta-like [Mytilus californianus]
MENSMYEVRFKTSPDFRIKRAPNSTIGEPWPLPQLYNVKYDNVFKINESLSIHIRNYSCDILQKAIDRFKVNIFEFSLEEYYTNFLHIEASGFQNLNKKYHQDTLDIKKTGIVLRSEEVWGALRGIETLSQVIFSYKGQLYVRDTSIRDFPRFKHRGVLVDSARHFMTKEVMLDILEGMYQNKMNVLHWHLVDDQSFPYQSKVFPDLSNKGAYHPSLVYTHEDITDIIEYARLRGVRVIPEFDTPGHVYGWGFGHPEMLTQCYDERKQKIPGCYGPLNPARNTTYQFLEKLYTEIINIFPDKTLHLGSDEVPLECWNSNPEVPKDAIIQIWLGGAREVLRAIDQGYRVLFSSCWYLDNIPHGVHWMNYYKCEPTFKDPREDKILGGEVCLWSEYITSETAISVLWPRASAAAERLWSSSAVTDIEAAGKRLQEHRCRMLRRGLQVGQINGPDYCFLPRQRKVVEKEDIHRKNYNHENIIRLSSKNSFSWKYINIIEPFVIGISFSSK